MKQRNRIEQAAAKKKVYMFLAGVCALLVIVSAIFTLRQRTKNRELQRKLAAVERQIETEENRSKEIERLAEYMKSKEYAEQIAREVLGLVKKNEILFKKKR